MLHRVADHLIGTFLQVFLHPTEFFRQFADFVPRVDIHLHVKIALADLVHGKLQLLDAAGERMGDESGQSDGQSRHGQTQQSAAGAYRIG